MERITSLLSFRVTPKNNSEQTVFLKTNDNKLVTCTKDMIRESALLTVLQQNHWSIKKNNAFKTGLSSHDLELFNKTVNSLNKKNVPLCSSHNLYTLLTIAAKLKAQHIYALLINTCIPNELNSCIAKKFFSMNTIKNLIIKNHIGIDINRFLITYQMNSQFITQFSHAGDYYFLSYKDDHNSTTTYLFDTAKNKFKTEFPGYDIACFSPKDNRIIMGKTAVNRCSYPSLILYDIDKKQTITLISESANPISQLLWSPDGNFIAATDKKNPHIHLWDLRQSYGIKKIELIGHTDIIGAIAFSPDSQCLISGSPETENCVLLWYIANDSAIDLDVLLTGQHRHFTTFNFTNDSSQILAKTNNGHHLLFFVNKENRMHFHLPLPVIPDVFDTQQIPQTGMIIRGKKRNIEIYNPCSNHSFSSQLQEKCDNTIMQLNNDGTTVALCDADNDIRLWNVANPNNLSAIKTHHHCLSPIHSLRFNNDNILLSNCQGKTILWDPEGNELITLTSAAIHPLFFNKDSSLLLSATCPYRKINDVNTSYQLQFHIFTLLDKDTYKTLTNIETSLTPSQATLLHQIVLANPKYKDPFIVKQHSQAHILASFKPAEQENLRSTLFIENGI